MSGEPCAAPGPEPHTAAAAAPSRCPHGDSAAAPRAPDELTAAAEARNDRFLREIVETWQSCPYASGCRDSGRLWRAVSWTRPDDVAQERATTRILNQIEHLEQAAAEAARQGVHPEVALLLFPGLGAVSSSAFDALHLRVRDAYEATFPSARFYVVAFHPDYPADDRTPHTLVRFYRRSPDPTMQFVDRQLLAELRRGSNEAERVRLAADLIAAGVDAEELARRLKPARDPAARVTARNAETYAEQGDALRAHVDELAAMARHERAATEAAVDAAGAALCDGPWRVVARGGRPQAGRSAS